MDGVHHQAREDRRRRTIKNGRLIASILFVFLLSNLMTIRRGFHLSDLNPGTNTTAARSRYAVAVDWGHSALSLIDKIAFGCALLAMMNIVTVPVDDPNSVEMIRRAQVIAGVFLIITLVSQSCLLCLHLFVR